MTLIPLFNKKVVRSCFLPLPENEPTPKDDATIIKRKELNVEMTPSLTMISR